jgi:Ty3 transposon capsid-like protein
MSSSEQLANLAREIEQLKAQLRTAAEKEEDIRRLNADLNNKLELADEEKKNFDKVKSDLEAEADEARKKKEEVEKALNDNPAALLANFTRQLTEELRRSPSASTEGSSKERVKTAAPKVFEGTDSKKLREFLGICQLNFMANPGAFQKDKTKITFAASYLGGVAASWIEPYILKTGKNKDTEPDFMASWPAFEKELRTRFGPVNEEEEHMAKLDKLKMTNDQKVSRHIVEFQLSETLTRLDDFALRHRFYKSLAPRLQDDISREGKPETLEEMKIMAQKYDTRYWEREDEKKPSRSETSAKGSSSSDKDRTSRGRFRRKGKGKATSPSGSSGSQSSSNRTGGFSNAPSTSRPPVKKSDQPKKDYHKYLGSDGKLLPSVKEYRTKNKLCMICGEKHATEDCPKKGKK